MRTDRTIRVAIGRVAALSLVTAVAVGVAGTPTATATPSGVGARFATYNIHAGAGTDNVFDLGRTAAAIRSLDADVVGYPAIDPTKRIDFVTVSPHIAVRDAQTQSDPGLLGASDHRAVVATVLLDQGSEHAP